MVFRGIVPFRPGLSIDAYQAYPSDPDRNHQRPGFGLAALDAGVDHAAIGHGVGLFPLFLHVVLRNVQRNKILFNRTNG